MALESALDWTKVGEEARFLTEPLLAAGRVRESFLACCWYPFDAAVTSEAEPAQDNPPGGGRVSQRCSQLWVDGLGPVGGYGKKMTGQRDRGEPRGR